MNLSKELKKKRDAEDRLRNNSPQVVFVDSGTTQTFDNYATKADLAGKADVDHSHEITELTDVSITYTDNAGKFLKVNSTEDGIDLGEVSGGGGESAFTDLTDAPSAYTDMAGKIVKVNSTEDGLEFGDGSAYSLPQASADTLGGIRAKAKTTESSEIAIDSVTGKLFGTAPDEAVNGIPAGGTTNQIPVKNSDDDYDMKWVDISIGADIPPVNPSQWDDEFEGTELKSKWSWLNQNNTIANVKGRLSLLGTSTTNGFSALIQSAPTGDFIVTVKHELFAQLVNYLGGGIVLYDSVNDKMVYFINQNRATNYGTHLSAYRVTPSTNTTTSVTIGYKSYQHAKYLRARVVSGVIYFEASPDGISWITIYTENVTDYLSSITHIGIGIYKINSAVQAISTFDWFRVTQ